MSSETGRLPGLDGLRAVAVAMVMAYHGGLPGLSTAGFYGVDVFFVLSGFLITRLLLDESTAGGRIRLGRFWSRRAKRLLPGLLVMLVAVEAYVAWVAPAGRYPGFRADALSVVAYVSNWHFIATASNYFAATGWPSLFTHTWSLAIEEQFYLVWPVVVMGAVALARRTGRRPAMAVLAVSAPGAVLSALWMAFLYHHGADATRLYDGTDTHAQSVLVGCTLAALLAVRPLARPRARLASLAGALSLAGIVAAACRLGYADPLTYQGGFLAVSLLTALLLTAVIADPSGPSARVLCLPPLDYLGRISYGMYLWYFPVFEVLDRSASGLAGATLFGLRSAVVIALAALSYHLVEQPVRRWTPGTRLALPSPAVVLGSAGSTAAVTVALVLLGTPAAYPASAPMVTRSTTTGGSGVRLLVFGDSTADTLGDAIAFSPEVRDGRLDVDVAGIFGCGLVVSWAVDAHGTPQRPNGPCWSGTPPARQWPALLAADIASFRPQVVLVASGRWEVTARQAGPGGPWLDITEPVDAAYVAAQVARAASIVTASGAEMALATAPCYSSGEQPGGQAWPEDDPARTAVYNAVVRRAVDDLGPARGRLVDLDRMVCPGRRFRFAIDGVTVRAPDGVHYPYLSVSAPSVPDPDTDPQVRAFGAWVTPQIMQAAGIADPGRRSR